MGKMSILFGFKSVVSTRYGLLLSNNHHLAVKVPSWHMKLRNVVKEFQESQRGEIAKKAFWIRHSSLLDL